MPRSIADYSLKVSKAFPAANANNNSDGIDTGTLGSAAEAVNIRVQLPAAAALVATETAIVHLEDSADNSTFADIARLGAITVTGKTGNGVPDASVAGSFEVDADGNVNIDFPVPHDCRRYVRANVALSASAGDLTALSYTVGIVV